MNCWKCKIDMKKIKDKFHKFTIDAWECPQCKEIIYDEENIQPILRYNKIKENKKELISTVGILGKSKIIRIPKIAEQLYEIRKGEKFKFDLKPEEIVIRLKND